MLRRAGRCLVNDGGKTGAAPLGDNHAVRARAFGGADDSAEVVRVANLVAHYHERLLAARLRNGENIVHRAVFAHGGEGDNALMRVRLAHKVELAAVSLHHDYARVARLGGDMPQRLVNIALGDEYLVYCTTGAQCLNHGVAPLDNVVFQLSLFHCTAPNKKANIIMST